MNNAMHKVKRESLETSGSNANTMICSEVRAPNSTSPPSPRRISNPLYEYRTPLSMPPRQYNHNPPLPKRDNARSQYKLNHLYRRGIQTNTTPINLYQRGIHKQRRVYKLGGLTSNTSLFLFSTKQRS